MSQPTVSFASASRAAGLAALAALLCLPAARAETLYVTDILRLGLYESADTEGKAFRFLVSGDALEILVRTSGYAQVRTAQGDTGWVRSSYLVEEKPTKTQLREVTAERDALVQQVAALRDQKTEADSELSGLRAARTNLEQNASAAATEITALRDVNRQLEEQVAAHRYTVPVYWLVLAAALALAIGFGSGWWWTDARQRARHGGFRI